MTSPPDPKELQDSLDELESLIESGYQVLAETADAARVLDLDLSALEGRGRRSGREGGDGGPPGAG